jgi:hypothetical protein
MWSAVALQQHITRNLMHEGRLGGAPRPTLQREGTLSLAQRMGLAPKPPPAPTETEWTHAEAMSKYREDALGHCSICCEQMVARSDGGPSSTSVAPAGPRPLVIASCSHVFHETCLTQLEKFSRRAGHRKQCPMCRREGYHTRPYKAAFAQVQRHAVVKLQAWARGIAARRVYVALRLKSNPQFHSAYYFQKLRRYADAMWANALQRERDVDDVLAVIERQQAMAKLLMLSDEDWGGITAKALERMLGRASEFREGSAWKPDEEGCSSLECPICIGQVHVDPRPVMAARGPVFRLTRDAAEAAPTQEIVSGVGKRSVMYGRRATAEPAAKAAASSVGGARGGASNVVRTRGTPPPPPSKPMARAPMRVVMEPPLESDPSPQTTPTGRQAVVTSCSHVFHAQCLQAFERHAGPQLTTAPAGPLDHASHCPVCRAAYVSQRLYI